MDAQSEIAYLSDSLKSYDVGAPRRLYLYVLRLNNHNILSSIEKSSATSFNIYIYLLFIIIIQMKVSFFTS